ncbi:hypothetical protein PaecuDRAFT_0811 [Paenibacillus curdlanolyticus YK9]|uniref:Uncharacterized protein n=1 Tax=Paenibacillus curdlanolyticus YK9 TaxID=717606 RepID=E0I589_9BACL|nr:hypothetical protein [Paenibacillus curdlanolyticus]EFM12131.1 hypothetical protein PaecuDRAFT_0811 [Paenibacillus curdlanolyticus YK9]
MKLRELITSKNEDLFNRVTAQYKINLQPSTDEGCWSSNIDIKSKHATIYWADSQHPEEAFTHELLHFDIQRQGFKRLRYGICSADGAGHWFPIFMESLDNELQHHKMYDQYVAMGYNPDFFYDDDDAVAVPLLINEILNTPIPNKMTLLPHYLTVTSAGIERLLPDLDNVKQRFRQKCSQRVASIFDVIDEQILKWISFDGYDAQEPITQIIRSIPHAQQTFIGYGERSEFPNNGFFTEEPFKLNI